MSELSVLEVWKSFDGKPALKGVSLSIEAGEIVALLGPSGCGKSTMLNLIAGLVQPERGEIYWRGNELARLPAHQRGFGLMFQDYALFPHLNVYENVAFGLHMARWDKARTASRVDELLNLVGLEGYGRRDVNTLSGGEAQRVALARSLAPQPPFLMLDEPLGALDRTLRERLVVDLRRILRKLQQTALYVTHDQEEAFTLADRVVLLNAGQVEQSGLPQELYHQPASPFVARFLGLDNLLTGQAKKNTEGFSAETEAGTIILPQQAQGELLLLLRPDAFRLGGEGSARLQGRLIEQTFRGSICQIVVEAGSAGKVRLRFDLPGTARTPAEGEMVELSYEPQQAVHVF